jgi:hypothetical protein
MSRITLGPQGEPIEVREDDWKRLGIGYGNISGQAFPEACAMELAPGPQGEDLTPMGSLPCKVADSSAAAGTDRNLFELFADDRYSPFSVELCSEDAGQISDPQQTLRYVFRFVDGDFLDEDDIVSFEFGQDDVDELDDGTYERCRTMPGGSIFQPRRPK